MLKKSIKKKWIKNLTNGKYVQCREALRNERNEVCPLGVLCNMHAKKFPEYAATQFDYDYYGDPVVYNYGRPPKEVLEWSGLTAEEAEVIIELSDKALASFKAIALHIERTL